MMVWALVCKFLCGYMLLRVWTFSGFVESTCARLFLTEHIRGASCPENPHIWSKCSLFASPYERFRISASQHLGAHSESSGKLFRQFKLHVICSLPCAFIDIHLWHHIKLFNTINCLISSKMNYVIHQNPPDNVCLFCNCVFLFLFFICWNDLKLS